MTKFVVKRIYEPAEPSDGYRVLLDRLWPRGVSKEQAALKDWAKDLAPSTDLRKWFNPFQQNSQSSAINISKSWPPIQPARGARAVAQARSRHASLWR